MRDIPQMMLKTPSKAILVNEPNVYSYWKLGAMQIDLTPLTLRITEDSAKQLVITLLFTGITMIRLIGDRNVFYVRRHIPSVNTADGILTWAKVTLIKK